MRLYNALAIRGIQYGLRMIHGNRCGVAPGRRQPASAGTRWDARDTHGRPISLIGGGELVKRSLDFKERTRWDFRDRVYDNGFRLPDSRPVIRVDDDECEPAADTILLVADALVCRDHHI